MINIGVTGVTGFVGSHLCNTLTLQPHAFKLIPFDRSFFEDEEKLAQWVNKCDVVVHLAALNRHESQQNLYDINVSLVQKLIKALKASSCKPHVVFASSTQEDRENFYGNSKKEGRLLLTNWANEVGAKVSGLIIPNVFGPFGKPFYNSVVATFCYQLCNQQTPKIDVDASLKLIYVGELVQKIIDIIEGKNQQLEEIWIKPTSENKVSDILQTLMNYKHEYLDAGIFPELKNTFELNLFNTFRSFINLEQYFPAAYKQHTDNRGSFVELARLSQYGQVSFSTTHAGITRGNHFHTRKIERFAVIKGKALIQLRQYQTNQVFNFELDGDQQPAYVDMPVWYTHNIKNIGDSDLYTVFWINEPYNPDDPDTYMEVV